MLIAAAAATPVGLNAALPAFSHPAWLAWGVGVGVCSSVIPYVADQLAMARLPRATFALMLALLPAFATLTGAIVLGQVPTIRDLAGIGLVIAGVALHRPQPAESTSKVLMAFEVVQRHPAQRHREQEGHQAEQQRRAQGDAARHSSGGEPGGQQEFHHADAARGRDD
jgi:hypothetical protein